MSENSDSRLYICHGPPHPQLTGDILPRMGVDVVRSLAAAWDDFRGMLHPDIATALSESHWSEPEDLRDAKWRNQKLPWSDKRGVYAFLERSSDPNRAQSIIYIGKATMDSSFGTRVWSHVWPKEEDHRIENGRMVFTKMEQWGHRASHIVALPIPSPYVHFAAALEEWLIERIGEQLGNIVGVKARRA